jgi:DNA-directed RNA polymerase specialized sigma24 family protein
LFETEHERLLRALFIVTGSAEEADELMQDAFVAVWERWDRVGGMNDPTGYVYRAAMNRFRSRLRSTRGAARRVARKLGTVGREGRDRPGECVQAEVRSA